MALELGNQGINTGPCKPGREFIFKDLCRSSPGLESLKFYEESRGGNEAFV
jgi:hypothetical protein